MPGINIRDATNTDRALTGINIIDAGGVDRVITGINVIDANGTDRVVWPAGSGIAVSVTPVSVSGKTKGTGTATTGTTTASASGGTGPYTYSWALTSYTNVVAPTISAPSSATTSFAQTNIGYQEQWTAVFTVTAKDSLNATTPAQVSATWTDTSGGSVVSVMTL